MTIGLMINGNWCNDVRSHLCSCVCVRHKLEARVHFSQMRFMHFADFINPCVNLLEIQICCFKAANNKGPRYDAISDKKSRLSG
jgi:hypothetical protein